MMIHEITENAGRYRDRKRVGRGRASGRGKTSGRGHKGAGSRSGWRRRPAFEGGQMPLARRIPKRGFSNAQFRTVYAIVNLKALEHSFEAGATIDAESLHAAGLIRDAAMPLKVLGEGDLTKEFTVTAAKFSASARSKIEGAGGTANEVTRVKWTRAAGGTSARRRKEGNTPE